MSPRSDRGRPPEGGTEKAEAGAARPAEVVATGATVVTVGEMLRRERDLRGVTLQEIAEETKISVRNLAALERNEFDKLPGGVYTTNFLRAYARYLSLNEERILNDYLTQTSPRRELAEAEAAAEAAASRPRAASPKLLLLVLIPAALVVLAAVLAWLQGRKAEAPPAPDAPRPEAVAPGPAPDAGPRASLRLTLEAVEETWVDVKVDGRTVVDRLMRPKEVLEIPFGERVELGLGDAGAVKWAVNGRPGSPLGARGEMRHGILIERSSYEKLLAGGEAAKPPPPAPNPPPAADKP
jgi:cytoskeleton protein RodZ